MMLPQPTTAMYLPQPQYAYQTPAVIPNPNNAQQVAFTQNGPGSAGSAASAPWYTLAGLAAAPQSSSQISSNNNSNSIAQTLRWAATTGSQVCRDIRHNPC